MKKEAIVYIHGHEYQPKGSFIERLAEGIGDNQSLAENVRVMDADPEESITFQGLRIEAEYESGDCRQIDLYEAYWLDLAPKITEENLNTKFVRGIFTIFFWIGNKSLIEAGKKYPYMVRSLLLSIVAILIWFITILMTGIEVADQFLSNPESEVPISEETRSVISQMLGIIQDWKTWVIISAIAALAQKHINYIINLTHFSYRYILKEDPLKTDIRSRIASLADNLIRSSQYEKITLIGHSFGTMILCDYLANLRLDKEKSIRVVTEGGPIAFLQIRSNWVKQTLQDAQSNRVFDEWRDFYSNDDYLCTETPAPEDDPRFKSVKIDYGDGSILDRLVKNHTAYYRVKVVNDYLLS